MLLQYFLNFKLRQTATVLFLLSAILVVFACSRPTPLPTSVTTSATRDFVDEAGRKITIPAKIERFVSLAPSVTEIIYAVGAGDRLVGNTTYCNYPPEAKTVEKVGDTLHPSVERIIALRPQLVFVSTASQLEAFTQQLNEHDIAVYVTDAHDLEGVFRSIQDLGRVLNQEQRAGQVVRQLRMRTDAIESAVKASPPVKVFYQLSAEPLYTAGQDSFVTDLIRRAGGISVTADVPGAWPKYSGESALAARPEAIILPTGGSMGDANSTVADALKNAPAVSAHRVFKINDDYLSRPGPRSVDGLEELAHALHPEVFKK